MRERAILVDWELYSGNPYAQDFVQARDGQARMILLVSNPATNDFDYDSHATIEWDAVIRNTGPFDDVKFKMTALEIIKDVSNLDPVIGLDTNTTVNKHYRAEGVLITVEDI